MSGHVKMKGTILKINSVAVTKIRDITPPGWMKDEIETTSLDSSWQESDETIPKAKGIPILKIFNDDNAADATLAALAVAPDDGTGIPCEFIYPSGNKHTFDAQIRDWSPQQGNVKSIYLTNFTLQPIGPLVFVEAT